MSASDIRILLPHPNGPATRIGVASVEDDGAHPRGAMGGLRRPLPDFHVAVTYDEVAVRTLRR